MPLPALGLLCLLELTRVLEEREGVEGVGFWFSFSACPELQCGWSGGLLCSPKCTPRMNLSLRPVLGLGYGSLRLGGGRARTRREFKCTHFS